MPIVVEILLSNLGLVAAMQRSEFLDDGNVVALEVFNGWSYVQNSFSG